MQHPNTCRAFVLTMATAISLCQADAVGDLNEGLALVQQVCSQCHATSSDLARSPDPLAPTFSELKGTPGMTRTALLVALTTPHAGMPMFTLSPEQRDDIIAYILNLR
jgi:mono/diheme cytochrome c family protein